MRFFVAVFLAFSHFAGAAAAQNWFYAEEKDPFTDELKQYIYGFPEGVNPGASSPYLRLGCYGANNSFPQGLTINWAAPVRDVYDKGEIDMAAVQVRVGKRTPLYLGMSMSADHSRTFPMDGMTAGVSALGGALLQSLLPGWEQPVPLVDPADFQRLLASSADSDETLALRTQSAGGEQITYIFPLSGFRDELQKFRPHCLPSGTKPAAHANSAPAETRSSLSTKLNIPVSSETDFSYNATYEADAEVDGYFRGLATEAAVDAFPRDQKLYYIRLPFYDGVYLVFCYDGADPVRRHFALISPARKLVVRLDGTSAPIHEFNARLSPIINASTASQYLFFFGFFVQGDDGGFYIAERMDGSVYGGAEGRNSADEAKIRSTIKPVTCVEDPETHTDFLCGSVIAYSNVLYSADMKVFKDGRVQMLNDTPLVSGLTMRPARRTLK